MEPEKIILKKKYRSGNSTWYDDTLKAYVRVLRVPGGGKYTGRSNSKAQKVGLAALMENEQAIKLHYEHCAANGWYEQIPSGARDRYKAEHEKALKEKKTTYT